MTEQIKNTIKKIPGINRVRNMFLLKKEYRYDYKIFKKNNSSIINTKNKVEYRILLLSHGIEKGLSNTKLRCFGISKVKDLIELLEKLKEKTKDFKSYSYIVGLNSLREYAKIYEENNWMDKEEYKLVKAYLKEYETIEKIEIGSKIIEKKKFEEGKIDYENFLSSRHSVREYEKKELKQEDIEHAVQMALKTPTACNRQMIKIYYIENQEKKEYIFKIGQGFSGFDYNSSNIFVITFDVNANYFVGERNQGWLNAGLVSMNFVNALHSKGIGSCFVQFGNKSKEEEKLKRILDIPQNERIAIFLGAGYYKEETKITCSPRKKIKDIYKKI